MPATLLSFLPAAAQPLLVRESLPLCRWGTAHVEQHSWPMCLHDPSIDRIISPTIMRTGCWECPTVQDILTLLRDHHNSSLLDIGANIGYYSLAAAASGAAAHVNAFEASPRNALMMQQSVSRSGLDGVVTLHAMALGAASGLLRLGVRQRNQGGLHHIEAAGGTQVALAPAPSPLGMALALAPALAENPALVLGLALGLAPTLTYPKPSPLPKP